MTGQALTQSRFEEIRYTEGSIVSIEVCVISSKVSLCVHVLLHAASVGKGPIPILFSTHPVNVLFAKQA